MDYLELPKIVLRNIKHYGLSKYQTKFLESAEEAMLGALARDGFTVIPGFLSSEQCVEARREVDRLMAHHTKDLWRDELSSDERFFGIERHSGLINEAFHTSSRIVRILDAYEKRSHKTAVTMAGRLRYKLGNLGSGQGWHRDRADFKQSKALIYLSDVGPQNGPFEYIRGSHLPGRLLLDCARMGLNPLESRVSDAQVDRLLGAAPDRLCKFTASAGTLLLVDTRGIHRGRPIEVGERYALTQYSWYGGSIPAHIAKLVVASGT